MNKRIIISAVIIIAVCFSGAQATLLKRIPCPFGQYSSNYVQPVGDLDAQAIFTLNTKDAAELNIEILNKPVPVLIGFNNGNQNSSAALFDFGQSAANNNPEIVAAKKITDDEPFSVNFDIVTDQFGFGNDNDVNGKSDYWIGIADRSEL